MPRHKQVTNCLHGGGPLSKYCTCYHCNLEVCSVCGCSEGSLTTDCPGSAVAAGKQQEIYETTLDYTNARGWHLGELMDRKFPRFEQTLVLPAPPPTDPRVTAAPGIDWNRIDRHAHLQHELTLKAIAWALADRACEDLSAELAENEADALKRKHEAGESGDAALLETGATLERQKIDFQHSCRKVERCEEEFKQAARLLVEALEEQKPLLAPGEVPPRTPF